MDNNAYEEHRRLARLEVVEGLIKGVDRWVDISAVASGSVDRSHAATALLAPPFSFTDIQAQHVLDIPLGRLCQSHRDDLLAEAADLRRPHSS